MLLNHGLLTLGPTIHGTLFRMYCLERACEVELIARTLGSPPLEIDDHGAVQTTLVAPCCLQLDGGSMPIATLLASAAVSTWVSGLTRARCAIGLDDITGDAETVAFGWDDSAA